MDTTQSHNKPYHHGNLHDELLRIAVQLGKEKGPEAITIRAVTRAAEVSPTSAYRHFKDQEELHDKVAELATDELVRRLHRTTNEAGDLAFPDHLVQIGFAYLDFALDETNFFRCMLEWKALRFMLGVDPSTPDDPKSEHLNLIQRYFDLLARHAQALGQTPKKEYFLHNSLLSWSAVHGFTVLAIDGPLSKLPREEIYKLFKPVVAGSLRGMDFEDPDDVYGNYPELRPHDGEH
ncbi:TetR/AcrR family transcriptional regulator [Corynebacterium accolens]|uniref:TetR/AcrR family transcriptional regulator n=1 Tax=Corynebacterium accolens TaxID=38284 RepID=UPI001EDBFF3E|nr:TetR/AcrR family transcriptional regulator [Corynebacterium accolens]